jgi:hypothetical protein
MRIAGGMPIAREALNFHISVYLYALCCIPLAFVLKLGRINAEGLALVSPAET